MKSFLLILLAACTLSVQAQQQPANNPLQFTSHFYDLEDHWVAFPKNEKTGKYPFGFIYLDMTAGFSFHLEGNFGLDAQGHIFRDSTDYLKNALYTYRLAANTKPVAAIPDNMLQDLKVKQVPDWLAIYKRGNQDKNTVAMKVLYGKHLNSAGAVKQALVYLEDAYKTEPHAAGLEFELTYSYNELQEYDKAIAVLNSAIQNAPANPLFYRELGFAYGHNNDLDNAINAYTKGINIAGPGNSEAKAEMAWNMAVLYRDQKKDLDNYKKWGKNAKDWAPANSEIGRAIKNITF